MSPLNIAISKMLRVQSSKTPLKLILSYNCNHVQTIKAHHIPPNLQYILHHSKRQHEEIVDLNKTKASWTISKLCISISVVKVNFRTPTPQLLSALFSEAEFFLFECFCSLKAVFLSRYDIVLTSQNLVVSKVTSIPQFLVLVSRIHTLSSTLLQRDWVTFPLRPLYHCKVWLTPLFLCLLFLLLIPWYLHLQYAGFFCCK